MFGQGWNKERGFFLAQGFVLFIYLFIIFFTALVGLHPNHPCTRLELGVGSEVRVQSVFFAQGLQSFSKLAQTFTALVYIQKFECRLLPLPLVGV